MTKRLHILVVITAIALVGVLSFAASGEGASPTDSDTALLDLADTNSDVRAALLDGEITASEVRASLEDAVECMESKGVEVDEASFDDGGNISLRYVNGQTGDNLEAADEVHKTCFAEHLDPMAEAYGLFHMPTAEEIREYYGSVVDCLRSRGHEVKGPSDVGGIDNRDDVRACEKKAEGEVLSSG